MYRLGWGATKGGFWSKQVLSAQADATLTTTLRELFPHVLGKDAFYLKISIYKMIGENALNNCFNAAISGHLKKSHTF